MRRLYILLVSAVLATTLIAVASSTGASAAPTQQKEQFGAQAFARSVAREGEAFAFSKRDAKTNALANCQARASQSNSYLQDCQGAVWVRNGWMAVAWQESAGGSPSTPAWGSGWGPTSDVAISHAQRVCQQQGGTTCELYSASRTPAFDPAAPTRGGAW